MMSPHPIQRPASFPSARSVLAPGLRAFFRRVLLAGLLLPSLPGATELPAYKNPRLSPDERVADLLPRMTLEEKAGQMCQFVGLDHLRGVARRKGRPASNDDTNGFYPGTSIAEIERQTRAGLIGSFLHVLSLEEANHVQGLAAQSRLGIPLIIGIDAIHGDGLVRGATVYPTPLTLASAFDVALVEQVARQTAVETRANGAQWTFSPNVDVARDARWGRVGETFGEDPYLVGQLGAAMVRGYEGPGLAGPDSVLSCIKHLIAGSAPVNGLNGAPMDVSERTLRSVFLPPYLDALKENASTLMTAHHDLNGVPCHANAWIVEDLMRKEGGFRGFVVSDWMDIERLATIHRVAASQKEAVYQTVMAGMDMHMHGPGFLQPLVELVREGRIPEARLDESARRILRAKFQLGLFEQAQGDPARRDAVTFSREHQQLALEAARRGIVLLKNDRTLPLDAKRHPRILVTGPHANSVGMLGDWVLDQPAANVITPLAGLRQCAPAGVEILFSDCGTTVRDTAPARIEEAARLAHETDAAIVLVGENSLRSTLDSTNKDQTSGENFDRTDLGLPGRQLELVQAIAAAGKPVIVVLVNSRPLATEWIANHAAALVEAWEPGAFGGQALAEILFGTVNPSGRLPISIPRSAGHIQTVYNHKPSQYFRDYTIGLTPPLFEFGDGLSYTTFAYGNLRVPAAIAPGQAIPVTVDVTNTGDRAGEEVVLAYVNDVVASVTVPVRELKAFQRIALAPGQTKTAELMIAYDQLALFNQAMHRVVEPGAFDVFVGNQKARFTVTP